MSGIEPGYHDFYRQGIWEFLKSLKPKLFQQSLEVDIRKFLSILHENSKRVWQVRQEASVHLSTMSSRKLFDASRPARFLLSSKSLSFEGIENPDCQLLQLAGSVKIRPQKDNVLKNDRYQVTSVEARFHRERSRKTCGFWFLTCFENSSRWTTRSPNSKRYGPVGLIPQTEKAPGCTS